MRIKEQVVENRSAACAHRYTDYLLNNTSTKHNKYVVNQNLEHVADISFRELFGRIRVGFFYKIRFVPSSDKVFVSASAIRFMQDSRTNSFNVF
jgi:hypothetical protein